MLRVLGVTGKPPRQENRIIFYSFLFLLIATFLFVLSYYGEGRKKDREEEKGPETEKGTFLTNIEWSRKRGRKSFPFSWQER